jgi:hypothetical protein
MVLPSENFRHIRRSHQVTDPPPLASAAGQSKNETLPIHNLAGLNASSRIGNRIQEGLTKPVQPQIATEARLSSKLHMSLTNSIKSSKKPATRFSRP